MKARLLPLAAVLALVLPGSARAHFKPGTHNAVHAIQQVWCGRANVSCTHSREAITVAKCEASAWWVYDRPTEARNGQFRGMFQMGEGERARFGHGPDPWSQARAAHAYWVISGWYPWQCLPYGGLRW